MKSIMSYFTSEYSYESTEWTCRCFYSSCSFINRLLAKLKCKNVCLTT